MQKHRTKINATIKKHKDINIRKKPKIIDLMINFREKFPCGIWIAT
jgi:hypothetical protein